MEKATEAEVYETHDEKAILWAIHKNLIETQKSVKTVALILELWFAVTVLVAAVAFISAHS